MSTLVVSMSTMTATMSTASSYDELTTMIANRDDEKLAVIGIALMVTLLLVTNGRNPPILSGCKDAFSKSLYFQCPWLGFASN